MIEQCDNFSLYGVGGQALLTNGVYASAGGVTLITDPGTGVGTVAHQIQTGSGDASALYYALSTGGINTVGMTGRLYLDTLPDSYGNTCGYIFRSTANGFLYGIGVLPNGAIGLWDGTGTSPLLQTTGPVVTANAWWHVEVKFTIGASTGAIEVRVEGQTVLTATAQNFGTTQIGIVGWGHIKGSGNAHALDYKDLVVWNTNGTLNNNFLGSVIVASLTTNSDVTVGGWTNTGGASHNAILAQVPPVDATVYTAAAVPPITAMVMGLTDLPTNTTSVKALMTMVRATKTDGGDGSLQTSLVSGASTGAGANRPITTSPTYWRDIFETDPATSAAWTLAAANAANLKIDRTV